MGVLVSEASVVLSDDITSPSGPVELLRLTLTKLLLSLTPAPSPPPPEPGEESGVQAAPPPTGSLLEICCCGLQIDNQLYNRASFHFPVLLCQDQRGGAEPSGPWSPEANPAHSPEALDHFRRSCFLQLRATVAADGGTLEEVGSPSVHAVWEGTRGGVSASFVSLSCFSKNLNRDESDLKPY